jgi:hypothetical protein
MARAAFNTSVHCVVCGRLVPEDRMKKRAITCSSECGKERRNMLRRYFVDSKFCRYCMKPATPEEQARFRRWRAWEKKNPPTEAEVEASTITPQEASDGELIQSVD